MVLLNTWTLFSSIMSSISHVRQSHQVHMPTDPRLWNTINLLSATTAKLAFKTLIQKYRMAWYSTSSRVQTGLSGLNMKKYCSRSSYQHQ
jgi:hypothetical protein